MIQEVGGQQAGNRSLGKGTEHHIFSKVVLSPGGPVGAAPLQPAGSTGPSLAAEAASAGRALLQHWPARAAHVPQEKPEETWRGGVRRAPQHHFGGALIP